MEEVIKGLEKCRHYECDDCTEKDASQAPWDCPARDRLNEEALRLLKEYRKHLKEAEYGLNHDEITLSEYEKRIKVFEDVIPVNQRESDLWQFTKDHIGVSVDTWGGWTGKDDGFEIFGFKINHDKMIYYFGLDCHFIKSKAL